MIFALTLPILSRQYMLKAEHKSFSFEHVFVPYTYSRVRNNSRMGREVPFFVLLSTFFKLIHLL